MSYISRRFEVGFAVPYLVESSEDVNTQANLYAGFRHQLAHSDWLIKPNILVNNYTDNSIVSDISVMVLKDEIIWLQIGYRSSRYMVCSLGLMIHELELGYSFAPYLGKDELPFAPQHQLMLLFNISNSKKQFTHLAVKGQRSR